MGHPVILAAGDRRPPSSSRRRDVREVHWPSPSGHATMAHRQGDEPPSNGRIKMAQHRELGQQEYPGKSQDLSYPYPRFSLAERDRRWSAVRAEMARAGVDVL